MKQVVCVLAAMMATGCATSQPVVLRQPVDCPVCPPAPPPVVIPSACLEGPAVEPVDPELPEPLGPAASDLERETWRRGVLEALFVTLRERDRVNQARLVACKEGLTNGGRE